VSSTRLSQSLAALGIFVALEVAYRLYIRSIVRQKLGLEIHSPTR
jgi:hypothetical protein